MILRLSNLLLMNTHILALIQSENERRNAPAVLTVKAKKGRYQIALDSWVQKLKYIASSVNSAYKHLCKVSQIKPGSIVIPDKGHKYEEVVTELQEAGISDNEISSWDNTSPKFLMRVYLIILLIKVLFTNLKFFSSKYTFKYLDMVLSYQGLKLFITKHYDGPKRWFIIGDLSPYLIALSAACKATGQTLVYWQYSFLDFKHLPCSADDAVILNRKGLELSRFKRNGAFWRIIGTVEELDLDNIKNGPVGVLLNVHTHDEAWDLIINLHEIVKLPFEVRLHPNTKKTDRELPDGISIADPSENLEQFAERISLGLCGNTQAQAKILMMGTPVLQVAGLDLLDYDFHGYIKKNIVPGIKESKQFSFSSIENFYQSTEYQQGLFDLIGPYGKDRQPLLSSFNVSNS